MAEERISELEKYLNRNLQNRKAGRKRKKMGGKQRVISENYRTNIKGITYTYGNTRQRKEEKGTE